ncbi:hypothetical protein BEWA_049010 [Theileria equi strain WA]|uniref:Uncharacterized protein n=1 Tax=Theileria equi strain WA TaxID=1537102 RepID=L1LAY9_THEEQ|nr:hypothetical protein BEWA_049010 [Theileria equi strain WA]EKX72434.1 hypothetical protein BEWA_049010 [Theileria equi strain WA]|eukprot:XP_004831886.1 hypothetical protein BEWA_049010 [Theileria equi strain WA]
MLSDGSTYTPKDSNGTQFIVRRSKVDASEFYQFIHAAENNARFKVESVTYGENTALNNIKSAYSIDSLSAYYYGNNHTYDDLILVQFGEGNNYYQWSDSYNWIPHSGPISDFIETLGKENCKRKQGHIINLSEKGRTNNTYQCPSCSSINIAVSPSDKSELGYSLYGHTISGGNTSISGFKDERDYQTGFSSLKGYSNVKIFWYPENSGSPLLIYLPGLSTSWYKRKTKDDNEWEEVKENAPFSDNDSSKILKLLKKINGESEGPSGGAIAGYTATGVMTPLATAEAVNYTLNTGWSLIRRVMAIFNAAV